MPEENDVCQVTEYPTHCATHQRRLLECTNRRLAQHFEDEKIIVDLRALLSNEREISDHCRADASRMGERALSAESALASLRPKSEVLRQELTTLRSEIVNLCVDLAGCHNANASLRSRLAEEEDFHRAEVERLSKQTPCGTCTMLRSEVEALTNEVERLKTRLLGQHDDERCYCTNQKVFDLSPVAFCPACFAAGCPSTSAGALCLVTGKPFKSDLMYRSERA
jgi:hypothetical protein